MNRKKILSIIMAAMIFTCTCITINPTKVSAGTGGDVAGILSNIAETFLGDLHQVSLDIQASSGADGEYVFFIPPEFKPNKFCISTFNYSNPRGTNTMYKVVVYNSNATTRPTVYNLHSGKNLELDTSAGTPEYIIEIYDPNNRTTPLDTIYLSDSKKNLNNGIALAQNNKIYYLTKETNPRVVNELFIAEHTRCDGINMCSSDGNIHTFIDGLRFGTTSSIYERAYRKSRVVPKSNVSQNIPIDYEDVLFNWYWRVESFRTIPGLTIPTTRLDGPSISRLNNAIRNDNEVKLLPNGEVFFAALRPETSRDLSATYIVAIDYRLNGTEPVTLNIGSCAVRGLIADNTFGATPVQLPGTNGKSQKKHIGTYSFNTSLGLTTYIKAALQSSTDSNFILEGIELYRVD